MNAYKIVICGGYEFIVITKTFDEAYKEAKNYIDERLGDEAIATIENLGTVANWRE